jgi:hypothetical protein
MGLSPEEYDRIIDKAEEMINKHDLSFLDLENVPNYMDKLIDLEKRRENGELDDDDAFKPFCDLANEYGY